MQEFLTQYGNLLLEGTRDTIYMSLWAVIFSYALGMPMGILLFITDKEGIRPNKAINIILSNLVNIGRSIPFIVLLVFIAPVTRLIAGKIIGATAAIVPLVIGAAPFVARVTESAFKELDRGIIDASRCMGATDFQIITRVIVPECMPSLVRGIGLTLITLIGYAAMAGAVGAGGLGDIAIRFGLHRSESSVMWATVLIIIVLVCTMQMVFSAAAYVIDKRK